MDSRLTSLREPSALLREVPVPLSFCGAPPARNLLIKIKLGIFKTPQSQNMSSMGCKFSYSSSLAIRSLTNNCILTQEVCMPLAGLGENFLSLEWVAKSLGAWVGVEAVATFPGCSMM